MGPLLADTAKLPEASGPLGWLKGPHKGSSRQAARALWEAASSPRTQAFLLVGTLTKATKEFVDANGRRKVKGNMDIELAVDAMELAEHIDEMVLFSGDGDFRSLVEAVQRHGVRVTVISTIASQPPMIADELRRQADVFIDLKELQARIDRDPSERPALREPRNHLPQFLQRGPSVAPHDD